MMAEASDVSAMMTRTTIDTTAKSRHSLDVDMMVRFGGYVTGLRAGRLLYVFKPRAEIIEDGIVRELITKRTF